MASNKQAPQGGFIAVFVIAALAAGGYWYYQNYIKNTTTAKVITSL